MEIKNYKKGDEIYILDLFKTSFKKDMNKSFWEWRFLNNPFTKDLYIKLMWDGNKLIGHYAVSPINMIIDGIVVKTALSMTTMTHPDYGGQGIFSKLAESLYEDLRDDGYKMVWGFPNNNSHYGFNKNLKWNDIALQGMMTLDVNDYFNKSITTTVDYELLNTFNNSIVNSLNSSTKIVKVHRTIDYLNWRYLSNPTENYKIIKLKDTNSFIIYKVFTSFVDSTKKEVDIMDFYFNAKLDNLKNLLFAVLNEEDSVTQFNLWDSLFSDNQIVLEKAGFRINAPVTYLGYRNLDEFNGSEHDYKNWEVRFSYSDVF